MYLGLDYWDKRCGIAIFLEWIVIPKDIIPREKIVKKLQEYIKNYDIKIIVVWLPFDLYWQDFRQLEKTKKFIEKLKNIFPEIKITSFDERFSSFEADNTLKILWKKDNIWQKDAISASIILEDYLKYKQNLWKNL